MIGVVYTDTEEFKLSCWQDYWNNSRGKSPMKYAFDFRHTNIPDVRCGKIYEAILEMNEKHGKYRE